VVLLRVDGLGLEHELGIAKSAHLRDVQAFELDFRGHALSPDGLEDHVQDEAEREHITVPVRQLEGSMLEKMVAVLLKGFVQSSVRQASTFARER